MSSKTAFLVEFYNLAKKADSKKFGILPETVAVVAALESGYGQSKLSKDGNNFFGIKAMFWKGDTITFYHTDIINGMEVKKPTAFRAYLTKLASVQDYIKFLQTDRYKAVRMAQSAPDQFRALQTAGYATDPKYAEKLNNIYFNEGVKTIMGLATGQNVVDQIETSFKPNNLGLAVIAGIGLLLFYSKNRKK